MFPEKFSSLQIVLWGLVAIVAVGFTWLQFTVGNDQNSSSATYRAEFELTDHYGIIRTENDFAGRWMLVFFGFANCPDVCPTTLAEISLVMDALGEDSSKVQPLFISIDPERDTPQQLAEFVPLFDANIIGLTGTADQIERTSKSFHIFYEKIAEASVPDGYTMGHSSQLFLFDPKSKYTDSWTYGTAAEKIVSDLKTRYLL